VTRTVLFVCPHGAGMSRIAAACFNLVAPAGWHATSAGLEPQAELGLNAPRLLAGTAAEEFLDRERPRPISSVVAVDRVVALCCNVPDAERWELAHREFSEAMRDEIRTRAEALALECQDRDAVAASSFEP
jgi:protein-tyrosine-phosphatase